MDEYGILSILPPIIAIIFAIATRQVFVSLLFGIWFGWIIISGFNPIAGTSATIDTFVAQFGESWKTKTIIFSCLIGVLILLIQRSGGVQGFIHFLQKQLDKLDPERQSVTIQLLAWLVGLLLFVESNISVLTVGTLFRPVFDDSKISREKLAYIADSSSAPSCILIPFNAWGATVMGLLLAQGYSNPFQIMISSIKFNFYPIIALIIVLIVILFKKDIGPMRKAEKRTKETGQYLWPNAQPMIADELTNVGLKEGIQPRMFNMIVPLFTMVIMMPVMLGVTGWEAASSNLPNASFLQKFNFAIGNGSGSTSVLVAVITAIAVAFILYAIQRMFTLKEGVDMTLKGISEMLPLALILLLAFAIGDVCSELDTGNYVANQAKKLFSPNLIPFLVFIVSAFIAFSTGTSWGTFTIMILIAVPIAQQMQINEVLVISAVLGGGVFGDHCSPISDTTIVSSMAAATDHIDHVRTQLPYALFGGVIASLLYLIFGFVL